MVKAALAVDENLYPLDVMGDDIDVGLRLLIDDIYSRMNEGMREMEQNIVINTKMIVARLKDLSYDLRKYNESLTMDAEFFL